MAAGDLIQLTDLKAYLGVASPNDDSTIGALITQISRAILNYINRSFVLPKNMVEAYDGRGRERLMLRNWPVGSVTSVYVDGQLIPAAPLPAPSVTPGTGWLLEQSDDEPPGAMQSIYLVGYCFSKGRQNVVVSYRAGYEILAEAASVPASAPFTVTFATGFGKWGSDSGVTYANGTPLVAVASNPAVGQYAVSSTGVYTFAAADAVAAVLLNYGYIPADLSQCAMVWAADQYRYRERIGQVSKSLGGQETASYKIIDMPAFVTLNLRNFQRVIAN